MNQPKIYLFVEGADDERFFDKIICPKFKGKIPKIIEWARLSRVNIDNYIKTFSSSNSNYIFFTDYNDSSCIGGKKEYIINSRANCVDKDKIVVVKKEIEAWYLAGLDEKSSQKLKIPYLKSTDDIDKEKFNQLIPANLRSRRNFFLINILKFYDLKLAEKKNLSLKYFLKNFLYK